MRPKRWTEWEVEYLKEHYASMTCEEIAEWVHHSPRGVQMKAFDLGLRKPKEWLREQARRSQFKKGQRPFNKGRKREEWMSSEGESKVSKTQFKRGEYRELSPTYRPIGFERVQRNHGKYLYVYIKIAHGKKMVLKHRWLWEQAYGPIPKGCNVQFKDGNTLNCTLDNLYLISRAKQVRKNFDDQPAERKAETRAKMRESRNKSIRRDQLRLRWGLEPLGGIVKRIR